MIQGKPFVATAHPSNFAQIAHLIALQLDYGRA